MKNDIRYFVFSTFLSFCINLVFGQVIHPPYQLDVFKEGFSTPVDLTNANDGSGRIFIVEKGGRIKIIKDGTTLGSPFLDLSSKVSTGGEQGLLGLAFHPNYRTNGYFFVHYTDNSGNSQISRFTRNATNPDLADIGSELSILQLNQPQSNHNGGDLNFGPDGFLYIGFGDGGGAGDPNNLAQNRQTLLGKMVRLDIDIAAPYIPPSNPFVSDPNTLDEIWAIGLRNPWRFSFDRLTGDMWIGDVGQDAREEINFQSASSTGGENYGWRCYEGDIPFNTSGCGPSSNYVDPIYAEKHNPNLSNSLAGGYVYRGPNTCLQGVYFCAETRRDTVYTIIPDGAGWSVNKIFMSGLSIASFGEDEQGELYAVSLGGTIYRITGETVSVNGSPIAPGMYSSKGIIESTGTVNSGLVEFTAAESIDLNQPFDVLPGATFLVSIGCDL